MLPPLLLNNQWITLLSVAVSWHLGVPYSKVRNILRKMVHFFPYKISHNQQLLDIDREKRLIFALTFLARVDVDASWPWQNYGAMKRISI
ncbi:hypothetical protein AVEN_131644-1 [Araneus ventricosus]|uniref:Transposase Helix-turn-helix domain-containing protein n=1 Tax=Araneus ventricosus TaxID=182803 RepID=A0A4Y2NLX9_ARAVE|nr:hypothetical protein AVEN_131644-1 [Araneus ventricosus]